MSLRRAFGEAGVATVIATLWRVEDRAAQTLITAFYENLWKQKLGVADALRKARLELLRSNKYRDPRFWAAFTLSGEAFSLL